MHTHSSFGNGLKTAALLGLLSALILIAGGIFGGSQGLIIALVIALAMNAFSYFFSEKLALRSMRAYPVTEAEQPRLYAIVNELAQANHMPMPALYLSPTQSPNAFATGRNPRHAAVCCTEGIMAMMDDRELRGVLGHEISHVRNRDILISSVAGTLAAIIVYIAHFAQFAAFFGGMGGNRNERDGGIFGVLALAILGPIAATLVQLAISRSREYQADASGARVTGDPLALASALRKLERGTQAAPLAQTAQLAPTSSLMIANPFRGGGVGNLFSTHPPMDERIKRLEAMAGRPLV
ncbi:MAG TPA: zinc metalloprotease HtpX [Mycobacteriales bacterium]